MGCPSRTCYPLVALSSLRAYEIWASSFIGIVGTFSLSYDENVHTIPGAINVSTPKIVTGLCTLSFTCIGPKHSNLIGDFTGITTNPKKERAYRPEIMPADGLTSLLKSEFKLEGDPRNLRETHGRRIAKSTKWNSPCTRQTSRNEIPAQTWYETVHARSRLDWSFCSS